MRRLNSSKISGVGEQEDMGTSLLVCKEPPDEQYDALRKDYYRFVPKYIFDILDHLCMARSPHNKDVFPVNSMK